MAHFCSAHCSSRPLLYSEALASTSSTPLRGFRTVFELVSPSYPGMFQKAETDGDGNDIVKLDYFLSKQVCWPARHSVLRKMEFRSVGVPGHHLATQGSSSALQVTKSPLMSSRSSQNCRSTGGISKYELFLVNARAHDDGTNLRLPLPNSFHQENTLANREGGPTSNQQLWELVFCSTGWKLAYSFGKKGSCV